MALLSCQVPGEDPYLVGEYAEYFVTGFERAPEDNGEHIQASACCKHYGGGGGLSFLFHRLPLWFHCCALRHP
jgi:beta-glucosidase-like glycosyl hydrolase